MAEIVPFDRFSKLPERYQRRAREIAERVGAIDALCRAANADEIGSEVKRLRKQFRPQPDTEVREMAEGFRDACRDLPAWAISEAANDFLSGRVDNHTGQFMPTCAEFAKRARLVLTPFLAERSALRTEAERLIERAADEARRHKIAIERQDPAVQRRVAELTETVTKGLPQRRKALPYVGLSAERQQAIDALKPKRPEPESKLADTRIVKGRQ